jgi:hypothetical protein
VTVTPPTPSVGANVLTTRAVIDEPGFGAGVGVMGVTGAGDEPEPPHAEGSARARTTNPLRIADRRLPIELLIVPVFYDVLGPKPTMTSAPITAIAAPIRSAA